MTAIATSELSSFRCGGVTLDFRARTQVMGILNVTPDSFSDGGKYFDQESAIRHGCEMADEGADILDVGGESTRPKGLYGEGAQPLSSEEEKRRVLPVIRALSGRTQCAISIDTYKADVAAAALEEGASIVNDVSGLRFDPRMPAVAARKDTALIIMHMQGTPQTMQENPHYADVVAEVHDFLSEQLTKARVAGVSQVMADPGIGFGKNRDHNLSLLRHLTALRSLGCPIVIGTSRKGFIGQILDAPVGDRLEGTAASVAVAVLNGANVVRVHDVKAMSRVVRIVDAIMRAA